MNKNIKYSQNFLTSEKVLNQIIKQLNLKETDTVYEIGTGKGHLTTKLAKIGIYELNVIDTTTHSIKDTVSAVKEKIVSGTALLF